MCQVWWSPCPSRECPEDEEINLVLDECDDHCLLRDYSVPREENKWVTKIEQSIAVRPPTFITGPTNPQQVWIYNTSYYINTVLYIFVVIL